MKNIVRLAVLSLLFTLPAAAQSWDWSSPGSSVVVDPNAITVWEFTGTTFRIRPDSIGNTDGRFPVTNTVGSSFDITPAWNTLSVTSSDNSQGVVTATLYQVEKCSSEQTELCSITSTDGDGTPSCHVCTFNGGLDFANNAYYVLVNVSRTNVNGVAALHSVAIY